jgi:hypothetical protein
MGMDNEIAWRLHPPWPFLCDEYRELKGEVHDYTVFTIGIGLRPNICYDVEGLVKYREWYMLTTNPYTATAYEVKIQITKAYNEPVAHYKVVDVQLKPSARERFTVKRLDVEVVRRIIDFAEDVLNKSPTFYADRVEAEHSGYILHVVKSERTRNGRYKNVEGYIHFSPDGRLTSSPFNIQQPIRSFI